MSHSPKTTGLYIFVLVLNLVFPVLGYTFTAFGAEAQRYETDLNPDSLMEIGINLKDAESHNLTYGADYWVEWELVNVTIRAHWSRHRLSGLIYEDNIRFQKMSAVSKAFGVWVFPYNIEVKSLLTNEWFVGLRNDTILRDFDPEFNWTRFVLKDGHHLFITPFVDDGNMTYAVFEGGVLNVTLAKSFDEDTSFNFLRFLGWYSSLMLGDQSFGLPSIFSWVIRILGALSVFAVVMLTRDLIPI